MPYKDKDKQREYQNNWIKQRRLEWLKGKSCVLCGSTEGLEVDHIDPEEKVSHRIWSWSKARRDEELAKCQVLCEPCHLSKTMTENTLTQEEPNHGTQYAYKVRKCKCQICKDAYYIARRAKFQRTGT